MLHPPLSGIRPDPASAFPRGGLCDSHLRPSLGVPSSRHSATRSTLPPGALHQFFPRFSARAVHTCVRLMCVRECVLST